MIQNPATVCDCDIILWFIKKSFWEGQVPPSSSKLVGCANPWRIGFPNVSFLVLTLGILAEIWYASLSLDRVSDLSLVVHSKRSVDSTIYSHSWWTPLDKRYTYHTVVLGQRNPAPPNGWFKAYKSWDVCHLPADAVPSPFLEDLTPTTDEKHHRQLWLVATSQRAHQTWRYM